MRTLAIWALAVVPFATANSQPQSKEPKAAATPGTDPEILGDPEFPSMFEMPKTGILEDNRLPGGIVPRLGWLRTDYLFWWVKRPISPPLIQHIPDSLATATNIAPTADNTLYPGDGQHLRYPAFNGGRVNTGFWFSSEQRLGLDGSFFQLEQNSYGAAYASSGSPILARFYVNANNGALTNLQFSNPDPTFGYSGAISATATLSSLWGADASFRWNGMPMLADNTDWLFGARYFELRESLQIAAQANLQDGTRLNVNDYFAVSNQFYGGQIGVHSRWGNFRRFSVDGVFKIAIGGVRQRVVIRGDNTMIYNGVTTTEQTGLYAQPSNSGVHQRGRFAYAPDVTLNLNYNITDRAALFVGYNFFFLSSVVRAPNSIDQTINDSNNTYITYTTVGTAGGPVFRYNAETFWLHGINLGLRLEY
jgi:Putative beta barrel porin-7 (BBP7)